MAYDAPAARQLGLSAKWTIDPGQAEVAIRVSSLGPDEVAWAHRVIVWWHQAGGPGDSPAAAGGELADRPIVVQAMRLLGLVGAGPTGEEQ
ncbi:MAG TPA: hypothetical protein VMU75_15030 [Acidimicrobiales bacterium]|nr:hypothetical protein [Acidimicrobiales bacterium]